MENSKTINWPVMPEDLPREEKIVKHVQAPNQEPCKIKLIKQAKGWAWEISMQGTDFNSILKKIDDCNETMKLRYGQAVA